MLCYASQVEMNLLNNLSKESVLLRCPLSLIKLYEKSAALIPTNLLRNHDPLGYECLGKRSPFLKKSPFIKYIQ